LVTSNASTRPRLFFPSPSPLFASSSIDRGGSRQSVDHTSRARAPLVAIIIAITIVVVIVRSRAIHRAQPPPPERCHAERARGVARRTCSTPWRT